MRREFEDEEPYVVVERGSRFAPFILGAALGAGLALLFAPRSGAATRKQIKRRAARAADAAREAVSDAAGDIRHRVEERIDEARETFQAKKQQVQLAIEAGRAAAHDARSDLEVRLAENKAAYRAQSTAKPASRRPRRPTDDA